MNQVHILVFREEYEVKESGSISVFGCKGTAVKYSPLLSKERAIIHQIALQNIKLYLTF
jgi:hypothetical protein